MTRQAIRDLLSALPDSTLPNERLTLLSIALFADESGACWPCAGTLAKVAGVSTRTITRAVATLERDGRLTVERGKGRGRTSVYRIVKPDTAMSDFPSAKTGQTDSENQTNRRRKPDTAMSDRRDEVSKSGCARPSGGGAPSGVVGPGLAASAIEFMEAMKRHD